MMLSILVVRLIPISNAASAYSSIGIQRIDLARKRLDMAIGITFYAFLHDGISPLLSIVVSIFFLAHPRFRVKPLSGVSTVTCRIGLMGTTAANSYSAIWRRCSLFIAHQVVQFQRAGHGGSSSP